MSAYWLLVLLLGSSLAISLLALVLAVRLTGAQRAFSWALQALADKVDREAKKEAFAAGQVDNAQSEQVANERVAAQKLGAAVAADREADKAFKEAVSAKHQPAPPAKPPGKKPP